MWCISVCVCAGHVTLVELMTRLLHAVDVFTEQKELDIAEEVRFSRLLT